VNPARSTATAVFVGDWAVAQLWLFWVAPIVGGLLGAGIYRAIADGQEQRTGRRNRTLNSAALPHPLRLVCGGHLSRQFS
jgi:H+/Cl- antiporter ClcA